MYRCKKLSVLTVDNKYCIGYVIYGSSWRINSGSESDFVSCFSDYVLCCPPPNVVAHMVIHLHRKTQWSPCEPSVPLAVSTTHFTRHRDLIV